MLMHWSTNAAQTLIGKLLPGLPDSAPGTAAFRWCVLAVLTLLVISTVPVLLRIDRGAGSHINPGNNSGREPAW